MAKKVLEQWEGYVVEVYEDTFAAHLTDIHKRKEPDLAAEIYLSKVPQDQLEWVAPGAPFTWTISLVDGETQSEILFLQERWTKEDIERIKARAEELRAFLQEGRA